MYKDKDLCLLLEISEINKVKKIFDKSLRAKALGSAVDFGKSMKKKYGKKNIR